jgi:hypothetical protein
MFRFVFYERLPTVHAAFIPSALTSVFLSIWTKCTQYRLHIQLIPSLIHSVRGKIGNRDNLFERKNHMRILHIQCLGTQGNIGAQTNKLKIRPKPC